MNKKAAVIEELKPMGIAIAVLIILLIGIALWYFGFFDKIKILLPSFNNAQPQTSDLEIIRYNISNDNIQWYDGTVFLGFDKNGQIILNKKTLQESQIKNDFTNYYFSHNSRDSVKTFIKIDPRIIPKIYPPEISNKIPYIKGCIENDALYTLNNGEKKEDVRIRLIAESSDKCLSQAIGGIILINLNNEVKIKRVKDNGELETSYANLDDAAISQEMSNLALTWRTSVLSKPIQLRYKENNVDTSNYFCASFYNPSYLKVDLSLPVQQDTVCPIKII